MTAWYHLLRWETGLCFISICCSVSLQCIVATLHIIVLTLYRGCVTASFRVDKESLLALSRRKTPRTKRRNSEQTPGGPRWQLKLTACRQPLLPTHHAPQQQQQQLIAPQDTYLSSRAEALHNVESTIHELGNIFMQLNTMVHPGLTCPLCSLDLG